MIAQDTGSAITGPARADLYFGAGADAGKVSGRLKNNMRFVILIPKSLDPAARGRKMPLPDARPSAKIARLFPQVDLLKDPKNGAKPASAAAGTKDAAKSAVPAKNAATAPVQAGTSVAQASTTQTVAVPLPEARPAAAPVREVLRHRRHYRYYRGP
jgi:membrane-bound lytic murein transglycosylase A